MIGQSHHACRAGPRPIVPLPRRDIGNKTAGAMEQGRLPARRESVALPGTGWAHALFAAARVFAYCIQRPCCLVRWRRCADTGFGRDDLAGQPERGCLALFSRHGRAQSRDPCRRLANSPRREKEPVATEYSVFRMDGNPSFPQKRESRTPGPQRWPWTPAFAGVTVSDCVGYLDRAKNR